MSVETELEDLSAIFVNDSLVSPIESGASTQTDSFFSTDDASHTVYDSEGQKKLTLVYEYQGDSLSKLRSVQLFGGDYHTDRGLSIQSTFKDINEHYRIDKIETTLSSAILFIDELNATIAIDKKELGLRGLASQKVVVGQIPDMAKIKYMTLWFD
ncbi:MAG: hypothetical protein QGH06_07945 [Lutibacter sp.]|nr:hypothetical protein [Lutibacter sp.]